MGPARPQSRAPPAREHRPRAGRRPHGGGRRLRPLPPPASPSHGHRGGGDAVVTGRRLLRRPAPPARPRRGERAVGLDRRARRAPHPRPPPRAAEPRFAATRRPRLRLRRRALRHARRGARLRRRGLTSTTPGRARRCRPARPPGDAQSEAKRRSERLSELSRSAMNPRRAASSRRLIEEEVAAGGRSPARRRPW